MAKKSGPKKKAAPGAKKKKFKLGGIKKIEIATDAENPGLTKVYAYTQGCSGSCGGWTREMTFCC